MRKVYKKNYNFDELMNLTVSELQNVKERKQEELFKAQQERALLASNILSLQSLIEAEYSENKLEEENG